MKRFKKIKKTTCLAEVRTKDIKLGIKAILDILAKYGSTWPESKKATHLGAIARAKAELTRRKLEKLTAGV